MMMATTWVLPYHKPKRRWFEHWIGYR